MSTKGFGHVRRGGRRNVHLGRNFPELETRVTPSLDFGYAVANGGLGDDYGEAVTTDDAGNIYVTGRFEGTADFGPGPVELTSAGSGDVFVAKYDPSGTLLWAVGLGGTSDDYGRCIAIDDLGAVYVGGSTDSTDFPTMGAIQSNHGGGGPDGFVIKLNANGGLVYSTFLGGGSTDWVNDLAVDAAGATYVTGLTASGNFPTASAIQSTNGGGATDVFAAKLNPAGSALVYSTYLGRIGNDVGDGIAVDQNGSAVLTGYTRSPDFPTTGGVYQSTFLGSADGFVTKLTTDGTGFVYSTFLGGNDLLGEGLTDVALDSDGNAYVTGGGGSADYPLVNPIAGGNTGDTYVSKLNSTGTTLLFSTKLNANGSGLWIAVDAVGDLAVTGNTSAGSFPVTDGSFLHGGTDAFLIKIHPSSTESTVVYASLIGGPGNDYGRGVTQHGTGRLYMIGYFSGTVDFNSGSGSSEFTARGTDAFLLQISDNTGPMADAGGSYTVGEGGSLPLDGSASSDLEQPANSLIYEWDLDNDGNFGETGNPAQRGDETGAMPTFSAIGLDGPASFNVSLRVTDSGGLSAIDTVAIDLTNVAPTATFLNTGPQAEKLQATVILLSPSDPSLADMVSGFHYSFDFNNDGDFTDPGDISGSTVPFATFAFPREGTYSVRGRIADKDGEFSELTTPITVWNTDILAIGVDRNFPPLVRVLDSRTNEQELSFLAFDASYRGGVRVATGDVNGDRIPDVIAATGGRSPTLVRVFDSRTGQQLFQFTPIAAPFKGGVFVAAGDVNGDGFADIIVGADAGAGPHVRVVSGMALTQTNQAVDLFTLAPFPAKFKGGVRLAVGDVNNDGHADIITAAGKGLLSQVNVHDGDTQAMISSWTPFEKYKGGVFVAAGDVDGDGRAEVMVSQSVGTRAKLRVFNGTTEAQIAELEPFANLTKRPNGVRIAVGDLNGDGRMDLIAAPGKGPGRIRIFDSDLVTQLSEFDAFDFTYKSGVFVG